MLVKQTDFFSALQRLCDERYVSLDTETTGLRPYHDSELFCVVAATEKEDFYFNFHPEHPECLPRGLIRHFRRLGLNILRYMFMANAKFDMAMLERDGADGFFCEVHDVLAIQRLIQSDTMKNNLKTVAQYWGFEKSNIVEEYITKHHLWEWMQIPGKRTRYKNKFFAKVPFELMYEYAPRDARITYGIGMSQLERWSKFRQSWGDSARAKLRDPLHIEKETTTACYQLEKRGVHIDVSFCEKKAAYHDSKYKLAEREFFDITGKKLVDSAKNLAPIFTQMGHVLPKTAKGADSITDQWLAHNNSRVAACIRSYREHAKLSNTYYKAFLWHRDKDNKVHASIRQGGTRTGRFSYGDPNLQNVPRRRASGAEVRKFLVPPKDHYLVSIDYDQQEYRLMLDYAGQNDVIESVLGGLDVHTATAELMGVERDPAKTLNFLLLYGGGVVKLATTLYKLTFDEETMWSVFWHWIDMPEKATKEFSEAQYAEIVPHLERADDLRELYFSKLPKVKEFTDQVKLAAKKNKRIITWTGRPIHFRNSKFSYKAPNALIQGGCSDIGKIALIELERFTESYKTKPILLVHDENLFAVPKDELAIVPELKNIMEKVYPPRRMPLTCSVSWSDKSWGDMIDGVPL
jgi:DNA polymerase I-like protein with 3'-5' exonuclease and polymerase domains